MIRECKHWPRAMVKTVASDKRKRAIHRTLECMKCGGRVRSVEMRESDYMAQVQSIKRRLDNDR
jgi:hypothetical protein